jgi:receptor protein-tyrosine kinase
VLADAYAAAFLEVANGARDDEAERRLREATERRAAARRARDDFLVANAAALTAPVPDPLLLAQQQALQLDVQEAESALAQIERDLGESASTAYRLVDVSDAEVVADEALPIPTTLPVRVALGLILGAVGAALVVAVVEKLNPRIDSPAQATELVGAPVLAMVPIVGRRHGRRKAIRRAEVSVFKGPFAEAFRSLRTHLEFRAASEDRSRPARIMVTSATPAEGKSTTAGFLAMAFAEVGRPPVVIGGDLRRPSVHKLFDLPRVPGLSSRAIGGGSTVALDEIVKVDPATGIAVVPAGPAIDPITGLLSDVTAITSAAQAAGRPVILDTAPVMVANDAIDFLAAVDWVVVVVRIGRSTVRSVRQMVQSLGLDDATIVGVVMVGSIESSDAKRYYYSYYSDRGAGDAGRRSAAAPVLDGTLTTSGSIATAEAT